VAYYHAYYIHMFIERNEKKKNRKFFFIFSPLAYELEMNIFLRLNIISLSIKKNNIFYYRNINAIHTLYVVFLVDSAAGLITCH
jgi:hypothetical protein